MSLVPRGRPDRPRGCHLDLPHIPGTERRVDDDRYHSTYSVRPVELKAAFSAAFANPFSAAHATRHSTMRQRRVPASCHRVEGRVDDLEAVTEADRDRESSVEWRPF